LGPRREGLLALSVEVGLGVLQELLELEVDEVVGPKGKWNPDRSAVRHGHEGGEVTLGGRRVAVKRPRVRTADGESELTLETYEHFAGRDPLGRLALERILAGVSTRGYRRVQEPVGDQTMTRERSTSKSSVSRAFVQRTREALWQLMSRQLGITTDGDKLALGLWSGSTENATVTSALLSDLVCRGLDIDQGMLFVIDGSKTL
jgi:transposase-like protein